MSLLPFPGFWGTLDRPFSVLAPMEDVTDWAFRTFLSWIAPPQVYFTEFAHSGRIANKKKDALDRLCFDPAVHRPLVVQIWGTEPEDYRRAIHYIRSLRPDGIDINMGCPQHAITKKGAGAAHIKNPGLAGEIVSAAWEACLDECDGLPRLPLSIKTRTGWNQPETESWVAFLLGFQPAALTLHARTAAQQSDGKADWSQFACLQDLRTRLSPQTKIIGNGDVCTGAQALELIGRHGLDGIMTGRGVFADPLVFRQLRQAFGAVQAYPGLPGGNLGQDCQELQAVSVPDRCRLALFHLDLFDRYWGGRRNYEIMKRFFKIYLRDDPGLLALREELNATHDVASGRTILQGWLDIMGPQ